MRISTKDFIRAVLFAFISVIMFFNIDSASADDYNLNPYLLWGGIISGVVALYFILRHKIKV